MQENKMSPLPGPVVKIIARQVRAGRGLIGWTIRELSVASGVSEHTIARWESGVQTPRKTTREKVRQALEANRVVFTNGSSPGVRLRPDGNSDLST